MPASASGRFARLDGAARWARRQPMRFVSPVGRCLLALLSLAQLHQRRGGPAGGRRRRGAVRHCRQPAGGAGRRGRAEARRQRGRRRHRRAGDAVAGRAAELRPRRRRVHELFRRQHRQADHLRRPRSRAGAGERGDVPRGRRHANALRPGGAERAGRPASPARSRCWRWRMASTAGCHGRPCSERPERTAEQGFIVSPRLARMVAGQPAAKSGAGRFGLFLARARAAALVEAGDRLSEPGLCRFPQAARRRRAPAHSTPAHRGADRRAHPRRAARRLDDAWPTSPITSPSSARPCAGPTGFISPARRRRHRAESACCNC